MKELPFKISKALGKKQSLKNFGDEALEPLSSGRSGEKIWESDLSFFPETSLQGYKQVCFKEGSTTMPSGYLAQKVAYQYWVVD